MGKPKWYSKEDSLSWGLRRGSYGAHQRNSWQEPQSWREPRGKGKGQQSLFPKYDSDRAVEHIKVVKTTFTSERNSQLSVVQKVQQAVNTARKSATRVQKLRDEMKTKEVQWDDYLRQMKEALAAERQRHTAHMGRLRIDLEEAERAAQEDQTVLKGAADACFLKDVDTDGASALDRDWDDLMALDEEPSAARIQPELAEILRQSARNAQATPRAEARHPMLMEHHGAVSRPALTGAEASRPPTTYQSTASELAVRDPYMVPANPVPGASPLPAGRAADQTGIAATRVPTQNTKLVEVVGTPSPILAARLQSRREARREALAPFGLSYLGSAARPDAGHTTGTGPGPPVDVREYMEPSAGRLGGPPGLE